MIVSPKNTRLCAARPSHHVPHGHSLVLWVVHGRPRLLHIVDLGHKVEVLPIQTVRIKAGNKTNHVYDSRKRGSRNVAQIHSFTNWQRYVRMGNVNKDLLFETLFLKKNHLKPASFNKKCPIIVVSGTSQPKSSSKVSITMHVNLIILTRKITHPPEGITWQFIRPVLISQKQSP